ncbi:hypothetical protein DFH28DRAFT_1136301 [Melampsora americana]|nr:hypothetical protein DFH28DRAFT_1136301 [Melampsora americana]
MAPPTTELDRILIEKCQDKSLTQKQILDYLCQECQQEVPLRTLQRHLKRLQLSTPRQHLSPLEEDQCFLLMKEYHTKRWQQKEVTLSAASGLNWRKDNIQFGLITSEEAANKLIQRKQGVDVNAGTCCMAHIMATAELICLSRALVYNLLNVVDADGVALRKKH